MRLIILERLQFIKPLEDRFVLKGETVDLHCKLNVPCNEEPKWSTDGQNLPEDDIHFKKENTPFTKKLTILNFQRTYAGVYQCACDTALTSATIKISGKSIIIILVNYKARYKNLVMKFGFTCRKLI